MRREKVENHASRSGWRRALNSGLPLVIGLTCRPSWAVPNTETPCGAAGKHWILFRAPAADTDQSQLNWTEVVQRLRRELAPRNVDVCTTDTQSEPLATLRVSEALPAVAEIALSFRKAPEPRALHRSVDLASLPVDARLLAITVATDELLRANWHDILPEVAKPPAEREHGRANRSPRADREPAAETGLAFLYESYSGGEQHLGADLRGGVRLIESLSGTLRVGLRQGLAVRANNGTLRATVLLAGVGLKLKLNRAPARLGVELLGRTDALRVRLSADADPGARAFPDQATAVVMSGGVGANFAVHPAIRLGLEGTVGGVAEPVHVTDTGHRVSGVSGLALSIGGSAIAAF